MRDLVCTHPTWQPTRERPFSDCGRPAVAWTLLVGEAATIRRTICAEHRDRYPMAEPIGTYPEDP